jgi:hypothetical protein
MTIEKAADALYQHLSGVPWLTAVGIGEHEGAPAIYLYVKSIKKADVEFLTNGWHGYHVEIKKMGTPRPLGTSVPN